MLGPQPSNRGLEAFAILGVNPHEEFCDAGCAFLQDKSGILAASRPARARIPLKGHHLTGGQCVGQSSFALLEDRLRFLALRQIDVGTHDAPDTPIAIIVNSAAGLDPARPGAVVQNAILGVVLAAPLRYGELELDVEPRKILALNSSSPSRE